MIRDGDRIAVGLSGGKDSTALLLLLDKVVKEYTGVTLVAITVDEGIAGYRDETVNSAVSLAADLGIEHRIVSFPDLFGGSLDTFLKGKESRACTICGILRKKALATAARQAGANRIATGHNLNDEAQSVLMNVLRGDLPRLIRDSGKETGIFHPPDQAPAGHLRERDRRLSHGPGPVERPAGMPVHPVRAPCGGADHALEA